MDWLKLIQTLVPVAVSIAEAIHPLSGSGKAKLAAATTIVQATVGLAAGAGAVPPEAALQVGAIVNEINQHVAAQNASGGVQPVS